MSIRRWRVLRAHSSQRKDNAKIFEGTTYLDHAGTTPYPRSLVRDFTSELEHKLFGNPHSQSPSSVLSTDRINSTRLRLLQFFKADPEDFDLVFVANATAAIKFVVDGVADYERFHPEKGFWYGYHADSHTSLVGAREVATAYTCFASDNDAEAWLDGTPTSEVQKCGIGLFAFPGQSNMTGRRLPLKWSGRLRESQDGIALRIYSLLDAAALASTAQVDLSNSNAAPDFTAVSLYKIFGFPDLGALLVRKASGHLLDHRRYFGGGTVDMVTNGNATSSSWVARKARLHERLEDGTPPFHSIIALDCALTIHQRLYKSMDNISEYTCSLSAFLFERMRALKHPNGAPLCHFYAGHDQSYGDHKRQGPIIAFNIMTEVGQVIGKSDFEQLAIVNNIQLRTGGVCNPGGIARSLNLSPTEMKENFAKGLRCGNGIDILNGKPTGILRVSLGAMSTVNDVERLLVFLRLFTDGDQLTSRMKTWSKIPAPLRRAEDRSTIANEPHKDLVLIVVEKQMESLTCPVACCDTITDSQWKMYKHYKAHRILSSITISQLTAWNRFLRMFD